MCLFAERIVEMYHDGRSCLCTDLKEAPITAENALQIRRKIISIAQQLWKDKYGEQKEK